MKLTIWREGEHAYFDWSGTDPQALGPVNFYLSEGMFKMFIGIYLIMVNDPQILFNDGFYPLLHVVMPEGSLLRPRFPAALGCRTHALARLFDVLGGALCKNAPDLNTAAGYGTSPYMLYSGWKESVDGAAAGRVLLLDGDPLRRDPGPADRRRHGRPLLVAALREHPDGVPRGLLPDAHRRLHDRHRLGRRRLAPRRQRRREALRLPRAGRGLDPRRPLADAAVGRARRPARASAAASCSCARTASEQVLPSKCDEVEVQPGDMLVYRTAGGGGWKDRLDRPAETVARDVSFGLVSREFAKTGYGVVLAADGSVDEAATEAERTPPADGARRRAGVRLRALARRHARELRGRDRPRAADAGHAAALVAARAGRRGAQARARRRRARRPPAIDGRRGVLSRARVRRDRRLRPAARPARDRSRQRLHRPVLAARLRSRLRRRGDAPADRRLPRQGRADHLHDGRLRRREEPGGGGLHGQDPVAAHARRGLARGADRSRASACSRATR